jgi:hypothetical protein
MTAGSLSYAWYLHGQLAQAQADLAAKTKSGPSPRPDLGHRGPPVAEHGPESAMPVPVAVPGAAGPGGPVAGRPDGRGDSNAGWMNTPEVRRLMAMQRRATLDSRYAALFRMLKLSPADLDKFKDLLVDKQSAAMDVFNTAREQGLNPRDNRDQIRQLVDSFEAETDASIRAMLGETAYQQYQQYEKTASQRSMVSQIEQRLSYSSTPLYGNQSEQLVNLLATSSAPTTSFNLTPGVGGPVAQGGNRAVTITDAMIAQSKAFLSQPQVDALVQLQQEQNIQTQLRQQMMQTRRSTQSPAPSGTGP